MELFADWQAVMQPSLQSAHEYKSAARDFIGDIPVEEVVNNDLLDYRNEAAHLPTSMPRADPELSFTERLDRHRHSDMRARAKAAVSKFALGPTKIFFMPLLPLRPAFGMTETSRSFL